MRQLTVRNLRIFFRDRTSVFFSLLAVFIIIGLYILFLGDVWTGSLQGMSGTRFLMDSWIMAGLLAVTSMTTTMGAFGIMVEDKVRKISKDFYSSPIKRSTLTSGYIVGSYIIGIIMTLITLLLAEIYIVSFGGSLLSTGALFKVIGILLLSALTNTSIILFIVSFFKSTNAFATASTIIGTLIGFLTGIYMPIGQLPNAVQWVIRLFPVSHSAALLRQVMMEAPLSNTFSGAPAEAAAQFRLFMGVDLNFGDTTVSPVLSIGILLVTTVVFFVLSICSLSRKKK